MSGEGVTDELISTVTSDALAKDLSLGRRQAEMAIYPWDNIPIQRKGDRVTAVQGGVEMHFPNASAFSGAARLFEYQKGLFSVADDHGDVLGSIILPWTPFGDSVEVPIVETAQALDAYGTFFTNPPDPNNINALLKKVRTFFLPDGMLASAGDLPLPPIVIPIEFTTHLADILEIHPDVSNDVHSFIASRPLGESLIALWSAQTPKHIHELLSFAQKHPDRASTLFENMSLCYEAAEQLGQTDGILPRQKAIVQDVMRLGRELVRSVVHNSANPEFSWQHAEDAMRAVDQILADLYMAGNVPGTAYAPETYRPGLSEFLLAHMGDEEARAFAKPMVMGRWLHHMRALREQRRPEERMTYRADTEVFYLVLNKWLNENASEETADTPQELFRLSAITDWLVKKGFFKPAESDMEDWGCWDMRRILVPYLKYLKDHYGLPKTIIGVDIIPQTPPSEFPIAFHLADLSNPDMKIGQRGPFHFILSTWSVPVDMGPLSQPDFFHNLSVNLVSPVDENPGGIAVVDIPAPETYRKEMDEHFCAHPNDPYGTFTRKFTTKDGEKITKKFYLPPKLEDIIVQLDAAGLQLVTEAPGLDREPVIQDAPTQWMTNKGIERITLVLQKVREPQNLLHRVWYGSSV